MKKLWLFFWRAAVKNLKKKENEDDFECSDKFDKGEFPLILRGLAPSEAEFYGK